MVSRPLAVQLHHVVYDHHRQFVGCFRFFWTLKDDDGEVVQELAAQTIRALVQELNTIHGYFFRLHHPDRERFEHEGWPSE
jgi:hypothetical protein